MQSYQIVKDFISETNVDELVNKLEKEIKERNSGKFPVYSDLLKKENGKEYQYVNYVQEGGGVLGVALVGYTYVLEKLGFRFVKLAGTSAGAINTMLLAAVDQKNYPDLQNENVDTKSEIILYEMLNYDLWNLVDGSKFGKWLIRLAINNKSRLKFFIRLFLVCLALPVLAALFHFILTLANGVVDDIIVRTISYATYFSVTILLIYMLLVSYYLFRFSNAGFGINPGNNFYDWMKDILKRNKINNTDDLNKIMAERFEGLELRKENRKTETGAGLENTTHITKPYVTIVASDITNQTKVEFPLMADNYWTAKEFESISPACFVRASMSIPVFFTPFRITVDEEVINKSWLQRELLVAAQYVKIKSLQRDRKEYRVRFVDGGILSNFPINVFHNPAVKIARMPTFGVKLEDEKHLNAVDVEKNRQKFFPFLYRIFSTVRFYYDRDFLKRNSVYEKCIAHVDLEGFNWLDFGMTRKTQQELFIKGAEAAITFLKGGQVWIDGRSKVFDPFNWEKFKQERMDMMRGNTT